MESRPAAVGFLLPLLLAAATPLSAQQAHPALEGWRHTTFDTRHGLPANRIEHLVVTPDGEVWAGTTNGLARYDHYLWESVGETYGLPPGPTAGLVPVTGTPGDVLVIVGGGLFRGHSGIFTRILRPEYKANSALSVASISPDSVLVVWDARLMLLEEGKPRDVQRAMGLGEQAVYRVWATQPGSLWVLTDAGLFRWRNGKLLLAMRKISGELIIDALAERPGGGGLLHVVKPISSRGVWQWNRDGRPSQVGEPGLEEATGVDIGPGADLLTHAFGGASLRVAAEPFRALPDLRSGRVLSAAVAPDSSIWLGTEQGALALHRLGQIWDEQLLPSPQAPRRVQAMARAADGTLWVATSLGLLVLRPGAPPRRIVEAAGVTLEGLTGLAIDRDGIVWVSSGGTFDGVLRYDGWSWQRVGYRDDLRGVYGHLLRLDRTGRLWLLGLGLPSGAAGFQRGGAFVLEQGRFRRFEPPDSGGMGGRVYDVDQGPDGSLWFAAIAGIYRYREGHWRHWSGGGHGLRQARVFTLATDLEGRVWFGHQAENEIGVITPDDTVHYVPLPPAVADTRPWAIRRADDGRIWLAGDGGVAVLSEGVWSGLGYGDGLPNTSVWPILPEPGGVLFGTGRGIVRLDLPLAESMPLPRVAVQSLVAPRGALSVRFLVGAFGGWSDPDRIEIRTRLDDAPWSDWTLARRLTAEHLGSGVHRVSVQAKGLLGRVGPVTVEEARVEGPLWTSFWFLVPTSTALVLLVGSTILWVRARRREAHLARQVAEAYRDLYRAAPDGYLTETVPGRTILEGNERAARIFGCDTGELVGMRLEDHVLPASREALDHATEALLATGRRQEVELRARRRDGEVFDLELSTSAVHDAAGRVVGGRTILRDVSARKAAERDLSLFRITLDTSFEPALWLRPDGAVMYTNAAACRLLRVSREEAVGRPAESVWPAAAPVFGTLRDKLRETGTTLFETDFPFPDGSRIPVEVAASTTAAGDERYIALFVRNIAERRAQEALRSELEARVHSAERLQALGTLAGGVAHEFNNLLAIILGYSGLLRETAPDGESAGYADELTHAATRGRDLVAQILRFSTRSREAREPIPLSRLVAEALTVGRMVIPPRVTLLPILDATGAVLGSSTELHGVIVNLVKNAAEAYGAAGGQIQVTTRDLTLSEEEAKSRGLSAGRYLLLSVADTAGGMPPEVARRVFEPFFTTKRADGGTGLGLSVVHGVVTSHGGSVTVESRPGHGTRFDILLPETELSVPALMPPAAPGGAAGRDGRRIMVIDDQDPVLQVICRQLRQMGCATMGFQSASAALEQLTLHPENTDLLLTDLAMPEMSGLEVVRAARRIRPDLPVLVASGYVEGDQREALLAAGVRRILPKPFAVADLADALQEAESQPPAHPSPLLD